MIKATPCKRQAWSRHLTLTITWRISRGKCEVRNDGKGIGGLFFDGYHSSLESLI